MQALSAPFYPPYQFHNDDQIIEEAANILQQRYQRGAGFSNPNEAKSFLHFKLGGYEREVFSVLFLDNQNRLIAFEHLFWGSIRSATVAPREVIKAALRLNAAFVILAHNHPSGHSEPSTSDIELTQTLKTALAHIEVEILDHIIVGKETISLAERGQL